MDSRRKLSVPTALCSVAMAEHLVAADLIEFFPQPFRQLDLVGVNSLHALFEHILDARRQPGDAKYVGSAAFEEVRKLQRLRFAGRIAAGAASRHADSFARGPTYRAPVPVGPSSDLCPGKANKSMNVA